MRALYKIITTGKIGETYNIGSNNQISNIKLVRQICDFLDSEIIDKPKGLNSYKELITYVKDRAGHDLCYGINAEKIKKDLNWKPENKFQIWY